MERAKGVTLKKMNIGFSCGWDSYELFSRVKRGVVLAPFFGFFERCFSFFPRPSAPSEIVLPSVFRRVFQRKFILDEV